MYIRISGIQSERRFPGSEWRLEGGCGGGCDSAFLTSSPEPMTQQVFALDFQLWEAKGLLFLLDDTSLVGRIWVEPILGLPPFPRWHHIVPLAQQFSGGEPKEALAWFFFPKAWTQWPFISVAQASLVLWETYWPKWAFQKQNKTCDWKFSLYKNSHILICIHYFEENMKINMDCK